MMVVTNDDMKENLREEYLENRLTNIRQCKHGHPVRTNM